MSFSSVGLPPSVDGSTNSRRSSNCPTARMYILEGPVQLTNVSGGFFFQRNVFSFANVNSE